MRCVPTEVRFGDVVPQGRAQIRGHGAPTPRLRFREMTERDVPNVSLLEIGSSRGPEGWIAWNRENYAEHGFG